jgi:hypothetical protein
MKKIHTWTNLTPTEREAIEVCAEEREESVSAVIRMAVQQFLLRAKKEGAKA